MSQILEFHFNPKPKDDLIFDSFCFEPSNVYEKRMGSLYMVGILKNALPQNVRFLDNLAQTIKGKYYKTISANPEKSLKESLRKANESLEAIAKKGDVSWLGNLDFTVISLKDFELNFTKVGDLKLFLLRKGQIIDIDQKLKFDDIEPYPLKIFGNIVSGKLAENDVIMILSKDVTTAFLQENILGNIARFSPFDPKKLKDLLNAKREQLTKFSGICLLIFLTKELEGLKEKETLSQKRTLKIFSFAELFKEVRLEKRFISLIKEIFQRKKATAKPTPQKTKEKVSQPKLRLQKPHLALPKISLSLPKIKISLPRFLFNKKLVLMLILIFFLLIGFLIFEKGEEKELRAYQEKMNQIESKVSQAETYLMLSEKAPQVKNKANTLFKEAWEEISPLIGIASTFPSNLASQILNIKETVSSNLYQLNKLTEIQEPEQVFEFSLKTFIPQKVISSGSDVFLFSPYAENVFKINQEGEEGKSSSSPTVKNGETLEITRKFNSASLWGDSVLLFSKPDQLTILKDGQFSASSSLPTPYLDFNFSNLSTFESNLYLLDNQKGAIIKYTYFYGSEWAFPQSWLSPAIKNATDFRSMAVDGSVWILTKNNEIQRYYAGRLQETLEIDVFPSPKLVSKIFTSSRHSYIYLMEPTQKRIMVLNKSGELIGQYHSDKFDNLLDFSVSDDGKTIYLLNGLKLYRFSI